MNHCNNCVHDDNEHYVHMYHGYLPVTVCKGCGEECDVKKNRERCFRNEL